MLNSEFDTIIRKENNFENRKNSKLKIFILIFIILIFVAVIAVGAYFFIQYNKNLPKKKFFEYASMSDTDKITDITVFQNIINNMLNSSEYILENKITCDYKNDEKDFSDASIELINKKKDDLKSIDLILNKSAEEIMRYSILMDEENIGAKSDEIVVKYIGDKIENIYNITEKEVNNTSPTVGETIGETAGETTGQDLELQEQEKVESEDVAKIEIPDFKNLNNYINLITGKLTEENFSIEEDVILTQNGGSQEVTLYELKLSKEMFLQILGDLKNEFLNDNIINCFISGESSKDIKEKLLLLAKGNKMNFSEGQLRQYIENYYDMIFEKISNEPDCEFIFDIYVKDENPIKKSIKIGNIAEIDLENLKKSENENQAKLTVFVTEESNVKKGFSINTYRLDNNISTTLKNEISLIENEKITNKLLLNLKLEGNDNSTIVKNNTDITYSDSKMKVNTNITSNLKFKLDEEIPKLTEENCLFVNELDNVTGQQIMAQVIEKTIEVFKYKFELLAINNLDKSQIKKLDGFIDLDEQIRQKEQENKIAAQNKLVTAVSNEMTIAEQENREYTLNDLSNLQIEGSTVSVMVGENMAIVAIDGFTFYIDPNFVLTSE